MREQSRAEGTPKVADIADIADILAARHAPANRFLTLA